MSKKVLIVDDSALVRTQVTKLLRGIGYDALGATDGFDAIAKLQDNADVALIVCDFNMPNMDGLELLEKLKSRPDPDETPFVMLTTESEAATMARAKLLGARGWITKPFTSETLVAVARQLLGS